MLFIIQCCHPRAGSVFLAGKAGENKGKAWGKITNTASRSKDW